VRGRKRCRFINSSRRPHIFSAQLVKHAFGLVTEGVGSGRCRCCSTFMPNHNGAVAIAADTLARQRGEIAAFAVAVAGAEVRFTEEGITACHRPRN
jgi:hypothetical protein